MKIKKGDKVVVMAGKDRSKIGKVLRVLPVNNQVVVEGVNVRQRRARPKKAGEKGQVVSMAFPLAASKVMVRCDRCGRGVRIGYRFDGQTKIRICRRCGAGL